MKGSEHATREPSAPVVAEINGLRYPVAPCETVAISLSGLIDLFCIHMEMEARLMTQRPDRVGFRKGCPYPAFLRNVQNPVQAFPLGGRRRGDGRIEKNKRYIGVPGGTVPPEPFEVGNHDPFIANHFFTSGRYNPRGEPVIYMAAEFTDEVTGATLFQNVWKSFPFNTTRGILMCTFSSRDLPRACLCGWCPAHWRDRGWVCPWLRNIEVPAEPEPEANT